MELHQPLCLLTARTNQMFQIKQHYRNYLTVCFVEYCRYRIIFQIKVVCHIYTHNLYPVQITFSKHRKMSIWAVCKAWFYRSGTAKLNDPTILQCIPQVPNCIEFIWVYPAIKIMVSRTDTKFQFCSYFVYFSKNAQQES